MGPPNEFIIGIYELSIFVTKKIYKQFLKKNFDSCWTLAYIKMMKNQIYEKPNQKHTNIRILEWFKSSFIA